MVLDSPEQRTLLLQILAAVTFPGSAIDELHALKQAIMRADTDGGTLAELSSAAMD